MPVVPAYGTTDRGAKICRMRASDPACKLAAAWRTRMAAQADPMNAATGTSKTADAAGRSNLEPRLCYDDLRHWLEEARKLGEVKDVSGLTWLQDIGMVAGMVHDDGAPCFVFDQVPGTTSTSPPSPRPNGTRPTAAATSAPAASTSPAIPTRAGSTAAPIA